jgi:hypothetical protein
LQYQSASRSLQNQPWRTPSYPSLWPSSLSFRTRKTRAFLATRPQVGSHGGSYYPPRAKASNYSTPPPANTIPGPPTVPPETYNSSRTAASVPAPEVSKTSPSKKSCTTASTGATYPITTAPYTVCSSSKGDSTTRQASSYAISTPYSTLTVTTPRVSTTQRVLSVTTTTSVLGLDTPGGPCSIPTNSSACPLSCIPVNGVYRCLNVSTEGGRCDRDSKNYVCDPSLICDEGSLTCRRAILEEDCLGRGLSLSPVFRRTVLSWAFKKFEEH